MGPKIGTILYIIHLFLMVNVGPVYSCGFLHRKWKQNSRVKYYLKQVNDPIGLYSIAKGFLIILKLSFPSFQQN